MKIKLLATNGLYLTAIMSISCIAFLSSGCDEKLTVMNPAVTEQLADRLPLTARLDTLEGKTLYLVDMNYEGIGGTPVMREMQAWFSDNVPGVNAVYRLKRGNYVDDDPDLWKEIKETGGDAVIMGVAG